MTFEGVRIHVSGYKCFGEVPVGFDEIRPINVIVGRNNTGKSSLLDVVAFAIDSKDDSFQGERHGTLTPEVRISARFTEEALRGGFQENHSGGGIPGNHWAFGRQWLDQDVTWKVAGGGRELVETDPPFEDRHRSHFDIALRGVGWPLGNMLFRRLVSDRDIVPEASSGGMTINPDGSGLTTVVTNFLLKAALPSDLVDREILDSLNRIYEPDSTFHDIQVQRLEDERWEVYLEEEHKGRIALSRSGSGLKTILLVLAFVHLVPAVDKKDLGSYVFGLEEIENNLHPALQRRLSNYLRELAADRGSVIFLTTHSNVIIDQFASDPAAQIVHVTHDGTQASVSRVQTYVEHRGVLDDLDVRASDLLQANGVIWVEGPSDRLYMQRWIDLFTEGAFREGTHYQTVFYGGRLLAHLTAAAPDTDDSAPYMKILAINKNALIVIDSDRTASDDPLNATKTRLCEEIRELGGMAWVTAGREIENYLPLAAYQAALGPSVSRPPGEFESLRAFLRETNAADAERYIKNKALLAERMIPILTKVNMAEQLDWTPQLAEVVTHIKRWNGG